MANMNETRIILTDETNDHRFAKANTGDGMIKTAIETKTESATTNASTPGASAAGALGGKIVNGATGGVYGRTMGLAGTITNPIAIATAAFGLAQTTYKKLMEIQDERNEWENNIRLRAGGANRGDTNGLNLKMNIITGKIGSDRQAKARR